MAKPAREVSNAAKKATAAALEQRDGQDTDHRLLQLYRDDGDMNAFAVIVRRHERALLCVATALIGDADTARDVVQEAFVRCVEQVDKLCETLPRHRDDASLRTWLCRVVRNRCIDLLRRRRLTVMVREDDGVAAQEAESSPRSEVVWERVQALPELEREAVLLRYRDGLAYRDIAERIGKTANHVGVILHQAMQRLRADVQLRAEVEE